jgi:serine protease inhibitor
VCAGSDKKNIMISPLSVSYALGMTYNGAANTTMDAFIDVLHFDNLTKQEVNESYKDLMTQIIQLDEDVELSIANSIWYKEGANDVLEDFISTNENYFDAAIKELDFSDPKSVDIINNWIESKTNDKIKDMLDAIPLDAYMYLINAIYFNASWKYEFDPDDTYTGDFTLEVGNTKQVDYMKIEENFYYTYTEEYAAVELPYGDSAFSMVAMLPSEENSVDKLITKLNLDSWNTRKQFSSTQKVLVEIPKFSYEFKDLLNVPLINLGLGVAFSEGANFSGITDNANLYISRVIHQSFIDVNEEGTEAAAATIVELRENATLPTSIKFDKPFLYVIKENSTGAILFMGKVGNPEY